MDAFVNQVTSGRDTLLLTRKRVSSPPIYDLWVISRFRVMRCTPFIVLYSRR